MQNAFILEALNNLFHAKLRTILALLGILVGTASVVAMVLGGQLATNAALNEFKTLGTDLLAATLMASEQEMQTGKNDTLSLTDALSLKQADSTILQVTPYTQLFFPMNYKGQAINGMVIGVTDHFRETLHITLSSGRFISLLDRYSFFCVIGNGIYQELKNLFLHEPIGETIQIGKNYFIIVGVLNEWPENSFVYADINHSVLIPLLASTAISRYAAINNIIIQLKPSADIVHVEEKLKSMLNQLVPDKQINFRSAAELISKMKNQSNILTVFLGLIGGISLLVGGIGVMNIMLVSVFERKREIGIRVAVGAKKRDIAALFLLESTMLSLLGGLLGVIFGIVVAFIIARIWHWQFNLFLTAPFIGFSVSVLIGIFFGCYPAYLAAKQNPIEALRNE